MQQSTLSIISYVPIRLIKSLVELTCQTRLFPVSTISPNSGAIMIRDRMPDLCANQRNGAPLAGRFLRDVCIHVSHNKKLDRILKEVEDIRALIQLISDNVVIVKALHNNVLSHTNQDIQNELDTRMFSISQTAFCVHNKLKDMGKDIESIDEPTIQSAREGPAYKRIKILQYSTMSRLFMDIMQEYNQLLMRYHDKCSLLLQQQQMLTKKNITYQELNEMLDAQETSLFVDNILQDTREIRQQLSDIGNRHKDLLKVEKNLQEIRDLFLQMSIMVDKQGQQINSVEYFAGVATDNVDNGRLDLQKAEKLSQKHRKRKWKLIIIFCIIIIFLLLIMNFL
ncbi:syntaxin-1B [Orussus abietinus]|uniref:syntaxin-1B n=1 Tax=Orussus abietinus TaxID=222816 RepID=UPI000625495E|nr:syntaxin-1B [Orussus abietinus]